MEKITFIIPSIGRNTLRRSVNSILNQTNTNWECIIIYDGCDPVGFEHEKIKEVKIEKQKNASHVRNVGLNLCNTEWIGFLDDDDVLNKDYVKLLFEKYSKNDLVVFKMQYDNDEILPREKRILSANVGISFAYRNKFKNIKFRCLEEMNVISGEDYFFLADLEKYIDTWDVSDEVMYYIRHER